MKKNSQIIKYIYNAFKILLPLYVISMFILAIMIYIIQKYLAEIIESNTPTSWLLIPTTMLTAIYAIKTYSNWEIFQFKKELAKESRITNRRNLITDNLYFLAYTTASITIALFERCHTTTDNVTISIWVAIISLICIFLTNSIMYSYLQKQVH